MINRDTNVELAIATEFMNGTKSVLKEELNDRTPIEAALLAVRVADELAQIKGDAEYGTAEALFEVERYLEAL